MCYCNLSISNFSSENIKTHGSDEPVQLSRFTSNEIRASYNPGVKCKIKSSLFDWILSDNGKL